MKKVVIDLGTPNAKQLLFYKSRALFTAYGGAKGGGKTHAVRIKAIGGALKWNGIRILIIRRTYPELQQNHIEPIVKLVPETIASYNGSLHTLYFYNGSIIKFGHYQSTTAEQEYQGQEYDWIFIDEATQFTEREFRYLGGCLRGVNPAPKRFYLTCNPGGVGHRWVKRLFIDKIYQEEENPNDYNFIFASVEDNSHLLKASPAYLQMLSSLPENLKQAYRFGDWNALSGAFFSEFNVNLHTATPFKIPDNWIKCRAIDYGLDMFVCLWATIDTNGRVYIYRETKKTNLIVSEAASLIKNLTPKNEHISLTFAPPDIWSRQKDSGKTMAEIFFNSGVPIVKADNNRIQGHMLIKELLRNLPDGKPGIIFMNNCKEIIRDLGAIMADQQDPNDCAKSPHDVTHSVDALRYFAISNTPLYHNQHNQDDQYKYHQFMTQNIF